MRLAVLVLCAAAVAVPCSAFLAATVQHHVVTGSDAAATLSANLGLFAGHANEAASRGAKVVVFPEFALGMPTDSCSSVTQASPFCEPVSYKEGDVLCGSGSDGAAPIATNVSCMAAASKIWVSINTCESTADGNYNTQLVFDDTGAFVTLYRKTHPFFTSCFLKPATPMLVTVRDRRN